uniref:Uncharacterized protein n=1 Tax=Arundo donax TaxID=35708 RepID=A0A0A9GRU7_ARUDO
MLKEKKRILFKMRASPCLEAEPIIFCKSKNMGRRNHLLLIRTSYL